MPYPLLDESLPPHCRWPAKAVVENRPFMHSAVNDVGCALLGAALSLDLSLLWEATDHFPSCDVAGGAEGEHAVTRAISGLVRGPLVEGFVAVLRDLDDVAVMQVENRVVEADGVNRESILTADYRATVDDARGRWPCSTAFRGFDFAHLPTECAACEMTERAVQVQLSIVAAVGRYAPVCDAAGVDKMVVAVGAALGCLVEEVVEEMARLSRML